MTDNMLIVPHSVWHLNLPQPLFDKEGSFDDALCEGEVSQKQSRSLPLCKRGIEGDLQ